MLTIAILSAACADVAIAKPRPAANNHFFTVNSLPSHLREGVQLFAWLWRSWGHRKSHRYTTNTFLCSEQLRVLPMLEAGTL